MIIEKKIFERPCVERLGTVTELTLANGSKNHLDASFPTNTPYGDLTFS